MSTLTPLPAPEPAPEPGQPKKPRLRALWKWSLVAVAVGLMFLIGQCGLAYFQGRKFADAAVQEFHQQLNAERYEEIYRNSDEGFRVGSSHDELIGFLQVVHRKLGNAGHASQLSIRVESNTRGTFIVAWYTTAFAAGAAKEAFTWTRRSDGLKLSQYHVESKALLRAFLAK